VKYLKKQKQVPITARPKKPPMLLLLASVVHTCVIDPGSILCAEPKNMTGPYIGTPKRPLDFLSFFTRICRISKLARYHARSIPCIWTPTSITIYMLIFVSEDARDQGAGEQITLELLDSLRSVEPCFASTPHRQIKAQSLSIYASKTSLALI